MVSDGGGVNGRASAGSVGGAVFGGGGEGAGGMGGSWAVLQQQQQQHAVESQLVTFIKPNF
jgi:hypothetical protein